MARNLLLIGCVCKPCKVLYLSEVDRRPSIRIGFFKNSARKHFKKGDCGMSKNKTFKVVLMLLMVVAVFSSPENAFAKKYSINADYLKLSLILMENPDSTGQVIRYTGTWKNEQNGVTGYVSTFYKSEVTGTQIIEFIWGGDCPGKFLAIPFFNAGNKKLVLNFIGGADCRSFVDKVRVELDDEGSELEDKNKVSTTSSTSTSTTTSTSTSNAPLK